MEGAPGMLVSRRLRQKRRCGAEAARAPPEPSGGGGGGIKLERFSVGWCRRMTSEPVEAAGARRRRGTAGVGRRSRSQSRGLAIETLDVTR
jgi:hypothetical protein